MFRFCLGEAAQLKPSVVRQLAQSCSGDHDESESAHKWNEVKGQEDDQLNDLNHTPRGIDCRACRLSQHFDGIGCIVEENSMRRDEILQSKFYESSLTKLLVNPKCPHCELCVTQRTTHIKNVNTAFVDEKPFEKTLDDDQALTQSQDHRIDPSSPAMKDGEKGVLWQKSKGEENEVDEKGYERQRQESAGE